MTISEVQDEVRYAWLNSYSPAATGQGDRFHRGRTGPYKISHLIARLFFRGIYFRRRERG